MGVFDRQREFLRPGDKIRLAIWVLHVDEPRSLEVGGRNTPDVIPRRIPLGAAGEPGPSAAGRSPGLATFLKAASQLVIGPVPEPLVVQVDVGRMEVPGARVAEGPDSLDRHGRRDGHPGDDQERRARSRARRARRPGGWRRGEWCRSSSAARRSARPTRPSISTGRAGRAPAPPGASRPATTAGAGGRPMAGRPGR